MNGILDTLSAVARLQHRARRPRRTAHFLGLGAVMKNEAHVVDEWLRHYAAEGVEHFYLIDDGSTDGTRDVVRPWIGARRVTLTIDTTPHDQVGKYNRHLSRALDECEWLAVVDLDEFVYAKTGTIAGFLRGASRQTGAVWIPWKNYGSSGHLEQPGSVVSGFVRRASYAAGKRALGKSIVRSAAVRRLHIHEHPLRRGWVYVDGGGRRVVPGPDSRVHLDEEVLARSTLHLNHYKIQSWEWFERVKMTRGDVASPESDSVRDRAYFEAADDNEVLDAELRDKHESRPDSMIAAAPRTPRRLAVRLVDGLGLGAQARRIQARVLSRAGALRARYFLGVGALMKNEAHVLDEWLWHHASEGVDHFYLIDNGSTDATERVLAPWIARGLVTLARDPARYAQTDQYERHLRRALRECEWLAVIDLDEFLYARPGRIPDFLRGLAPTVGAVKVPWKTFGSSGHIEQPPSVIDGFVQRGSFAGGIAVQYKSVVRSTALSYFDVHEHSLVSGYVAIDSAGREVPHGQGQIRLSEEELATTALHLNHYRVQSRRWFEEVKLTRGDAFSPEHERHREMVHFVRNDRNEVRDVELRDKRARSSFAGIGG